MELFFNLTLDEGGCSAINGPRLASNNKRSLLNFRLKISIPDLCDQFPNKIH